MTSICIDLTWKTALQAANVLMFQHTGEYLSDVEIIILHGAWHKQTYEKIAEEQGYTGSYLCKDIGHSLWRKLSAALKVKVSKTNFKAVLRREWRKYTKAILSENRNRLGQLLPIDNITLFEGLIVLNSTLYIERLPTETVCYEEILKPGSLIRIEGAKWMGKTSLVNQILTQGNLQAQRTVYLDFDTIDLDIIQDINKLLIWLSTTVSQQLNIENKFQDIWNQDISRNDDCTVYFGDYILTKVKSSIILALDNIDHLFNYQKVAESFFKMLYKWHKKGKYSSHWSKLKLITTQSIKVNVPFNINYLFLNTGTLVSLEEFDFWQVKSLANFYQLDWKDRDIARLIDEIGGNPYLVRLAMYQTKIKNLTFSH